MGAYPPVPMAVVLEISRTPVVAQPLIFRVKDLRAKQFIRTRMTIKQPKHKGLIHAAEELQRISMLHKHCAAELPD